LETEFIIALVTTASKAEAEKISQNLLEANLVACVNIVGPVVSHFHWGEKVEKAEEFLLLMKSRSDLFEKLSQAVVALHSYEVPEIIALPIVAGSKAYMNWLAASLR
jgi:periplasmic divalent cation tolerance protein